MSANLMILGMAAQEEAELSTFWLVLGFGAQALFTARFLVQWLASERAGRSIVPTSFWFLSLVGSSLLLTYAIYRQDPVFILGQSSGLFIYTRNLWLIQRERNREDAEASAVVKPSGTKDSGTDEARTDPGDSEPVPPEKRLASTPPAAEPPAPCAKGKESRKKSKEAAA